ncbi:GNAT family N-acetyltransferase [Staphylospora marina]|uniref:GNAT family N-acetyltransferase n=1 Tax=Staphylospora marina TaxID=2490858 RepID=UPI000F5BA56F|nr:GNAT family N-acetyltransferase [Staphylospora marina]
MKEVSPILMDFPDSFETERLLIRLPLPGDGGLVHEAITESLEFLRPWMPWARKPPTPEETEARTREAYVRFLERTDLRFHLFEKETRRFVGSSGLHRINWSVPSFEIGYWCRKGFTGKGYITESVRALTVFAFELLHAARVEIRCDKRNVRSRKVAERLGYRLEGILRNHEVDVDGTLRDTCIYSMIPEDFRTMLLKHRHGSGSVFF